MESPPGAGNSSIRPQFIKCISPDAIWRVGLWTPPATHKFGCNEVRETGRARAWGQDPGGSYAPQTPHLSHIVACPRPRAEPRFFWGRLWTLPLDRRHSVTRINCPAPRTPSLGKEARGGDAQRAEPLRWCPNPLREAVLRPNDGWGALKGGKPQP